MALRGILGISELSGYCVAHIRFGSHALRTVTLVWKIKDRMRERNAQPHDLVFPNGNGKPDGHFLRKLQAIAKKAGVKGVELHRFRKTCADTLHEGGVSVNTIRIRLGHESLDVTLAYLKGKDAESEEAQEHANSSGLAPHA